MVLKFVVNQTTLHQFKPMCVIAPLRDVAQFVTIQNRASSRYAYHKYISFVIGSLGS